VPGLFPPPAPPVREGTQMSDTPTAGISQALDDAPMGLFHLRAVVTSGMGFFTDAYDLFIIGIAATLVKGQWHLGAGQLSLLNSMTLLAAVVGAFVFGRIADVLGRKRIYGLVAMIMVIGALGSAFAPNLAVLIAARFVLGLGIGGDYPVSAVLMSEYANRRDRGRLVGLVFSMQALGLIVGPVVGLTLLGAGVHPGIAWRIMLGLGAVPAAAVIYFRRRMPESPRFQARVRGDAALAAAGLAEYSAGSVIANGNGVNPTRRMTLRHFLTNRRYLLTLLGTAGTWFILDYAYYGNTISTPQILKMVSPHTTPLRSTALTLMIFAIAAVPGYVLAVALMDRIGHRRLQWIGFLVMAAAFAVIGLVPGVTVAIVPFLLAYGVSYLFSEFGPNTTTFVLAAELYPVSMRTTGHGISAGVAKLGAFVGVFVFPLLSSSLGLRGTLIITAGFAVLGALLTFVLPEASGRSLEDISREDVVGAAERLLLERPEEVNLPAALP
jgi:PHS family inorganic phosphate transporter-like MFS transporter